MKSYENIGLEFQIGVSQHTCRSGMYEIGKLHHHVTVC